MRETPFVLLLGDDGSIRFVNMLLLCSAELVKGALKIKMADGTGFSIEGGAAEGLFDYLGKLSTTPDGTPAGAVLSRSLQQIRSGS